MLIKLLDSLITTSILTTCRNRKFLLESRVSFEFLNKRRLCSKKDDDGSEKELDLQDLLNKSSPLKSSAKDDFWGTSPYPVGTVFRDSDEEDKRLETRTSKSVVMFPGQGNQFVGMAKNLLKYPVALDMFNAAKEILGYDLVKICLEGPRETLDRTKYCQPATFVCSLALLEKIKEEKPWIISNCVATCGYSLGELTALVFAGCVSFEEGLNLVKERAEVMEGCCKQTPGGMLTILTGPMTTLHQGVTDAIEHCKSLGIEKPVCSVASYLFPNCKVIGGNKEALEYLSKNYKKYAIKRCSFLAVSGAFHTVLMNDAVEHFKGKLKTVQIKKPIIKVFSNVTSKPYISAKDIKKILPKQISCPVKWQQTMQNVFLRYNHLDLYLYECGPGNSLTTVATKNNYQASSYCFAIQL